MRDLSTHQILTLYSWFALTALIALAALIARFYERLSGERTYYRWFALPVVAFAGATVQLAVTDQITGDLGADLCLLIGGLVLTALCLNMYRRMTSGR